MPERSANAFHTTHWTQVVAARGGTPEAQQALRMLCETYYAPVEFFIRRYRGQMLSAQSDEARDLTHEFFAKLLEGQSLDRADRARGRFRTYLLGAVKHFLADARDRERSLKRGGGEIVESLDQPQDAGLSNSEPASHRDIVDPHAFPPDSYFDHQWALAVVEQTIAALRAEAEVANDLSRFEVLQRWLVTPADPGTAITVARSLEMTDGAFKVAVHRLRKRFRQIITDRIAATVEDPNEVRDELNYLVAAIAAQ